MNNDIRRFLIGAIAIGLLSLLFFIIPITPALIISYIFTIIAIVIFIGRFKALGKRNNDAPQSYANIQIACGYIVSTLVFSLLAYIFLSFNVLLTLIIHIAILGVFSIMFLIIGAGNEYISKLDNQEISEERKKFVEEKKKYWK